MDARKLKLITVGLVREFNKRTFICLRPEYHKALHLLEHFSHILIIWLEKEKKGPQGGLPEKDFFYKIKNLRNPNKNCSLRLFIAKIVDIDKKSGRIEIDYLDSYDEAPVADIKPYFPSEDRVKEISVRHTDLEKYKWRPENHYISKDEIIAAREFNRLKEEDDFSYLPEIGAIRQKQEKYFLELPGIDKDALKKFADFSYLRIFWWFNRFDKDIFRAATCCHPPYEGAPKTGVFASRSPVRPNPIAVSTARIIHLDLKNNIIEVTRLDAFDNTPVIEIKPYIPVYDRVENFVVPKWVSHWPEWFLEEGEAQATDISQVKAADIERLREYQNQNPKPRAASFSFAQLPGPKAKKEYLVIKGARQNNLKNITIKIPKNKLTVITGPSGSGKSSLAFDTIYKESQRRFMDSLSTTGRSIFEQYQKPDADEITGLCPAIAIEQRRLHNSPRSTVGTVTEIYDYLRVLFTGIGTRYCPSCGKAIKTLSSAEITAELLRLRENIEFEILSFSDKKSLGCFVVKNDNREQLKRDLKEIVAKALDTGNGALLIKLKNGGEYVLHSRTNCYYCRRVFFELNPASFSYNNPQGMCPDCKGMGVILDVDEDLIVTDPVSSILDGASPWWGNLRKFIQKPSGNWLKGEVIALAREMNVDLELPWEKLPQEFRTKALYGTNNRPLKFSYKSAKGRSGDINRPVTGAIHNIKRMFKETQGESSRQFYLQFMGTKKCPSCQGERLILESRLVRIHETRYPEAAAMTIQELYDWIKSLPGVLPGRQLEIAKEVLGGLFNKLTILIEIGVAYLNLGRAVPTLSNGESQRIKIATQLGCGLTDLLYVMDEPSIGLHPYNHATLLNTIKKLRDLGNTVIVVEHDKDTMQNADYLIDLGPNAGLNGGKVMAAGTLQEVLENRDSITAKYLKNTLKVEKQVSRKKTSDWLCLFGAKHNNLKNIDVKFPVGAFTCITGVSGSGKSSLISQTLFPILQRHFTNAKETPGKYKKVTGLEHIDKVIGVTQSPIGRSPRSNPATYTGVFDRIRDLFAESEQAKKLGYKANYFSFNSKAGGCACCGGEGRRKIEMNFMPDIWVTCPECQGKRFNGQTLEIEFNGKNIAAVLDMEIGQALDFFSCYPKITNILETLNEVGLGYLKLGQSALSLSGGEAQRIKLAKELARPDTGKTLFILDEPTTGLHFIDMQNLLDMIFKIREAGNTIMVIEHNLDLIKNADWIIDLGPEAGQRGGYLVGNGTVEDIMNTADSLTGKYLRQYG